MLFHENALSISYQAGAFYFLFIAGTTMEEIVTKLLSKNHRLQCTESIRWRRMICGVCGYLG
jgi:hypothetical protein